MEVHRTPVPLESGSDVDSQKPLNAEQAASMSFIDTNTDTSTIALSPSNSLAPGALTSRLLL